MEFAKSLGVDLNQYPAILGRIVIANESALSPSGGSIDGIEIPA